MLLIHLSIPHQHLLAFLNGHLLPARPCLVCGSHSIVDVLFRSDWDGPELFESNGVDAVMSAGAATRLSINDVGEGCKGDLLLCYNT